MVGFQPLGRLGYQLDWIDGGLEFTDKGLVFGRPVRFGQGRRFYLQYYNISDMFRPTLVFIKL